MGGGKVHLPFVHSTRAYPEHPLAKLKHTSIELAEKVVVALLAMPKDSPAALAANISGWTIPLNYQDVHACLKELKIRPYKDFGKITTQAIFKKYWILISIIFSILVTLAWLLTTRIRLNRKIKTTNKSLKIEIDERILTEKALQKSEKKYRKLADSLPQGVFETDEIGKITYVNQNAFDLLKYPKDALDKGFNAIQMMIPEDRDRAIENIQKVLNGNQIGGVEYTALRHDGSTFPVIVHTNLVTQNGKPIGLRGLVIDTSEQKKWRKI